MMQEKDVQRLKDKLQNGKRAEVRKALKKLNPDKVPRNLALPVARLARQAGVLAVGMRLVSPKRPTPSGAELVEYASLLRRAGLIDEAFKLLQQPKVAALPESRLVRAQCLISQWRWEEAATVLSEFSERDHVSPQARLTALVNLLAAYIYTGNSERVDELLSELPRHLETTNDRQLQRRYHELNAQWEIMRGHLNAAALAVERAQGFIRDSESLEAQALKKWTSIIGAYQSGITGELFLYKEVARSLGLYETVREVDFHYLKIKMDPNRAAFLYAGTPFAPFRTALKKSLEHWQAPVGDFEWGRSGDTLDLKRGTWRGAPLFSPDTPAFRLLRCLSADLYKPRTTGELYAAMHPGKPFDVDTSPQEVRKELDKLRAKLKANSIALEIARVNQGYQLEKSPSGLVLRIPIS